MNDRRLGVGFVGSGFITRFHIQSFTGVRDGDVRGVWSPNKKNAAAAPDIDAIWLTGPNHARIENVEEIVHAIESGKGELKGIACEKPLARNVAEAKEVARLVKRVGLAHGYLEDQVFVPHELQGRALLWARGAATTGRPYLARAAEEHSGPHAPWFWRGDLQGGGVLNVRHLLTKPGEPLSTVRPVRVSAHIASLKWTRPEYAKRLRKRMGKEVDY